DENNLVYIAAKSIFDRCRKKLAGLHIKQKNDIPMTRGLGSSSACVVAGILGANTLLGNPFTRKELLDIAVSFEGHPDNVAPAFYGGLSISVVTDTGLMSSRLPIKDD